MADMSKRRSKGKNQSTRRPRGALASGPGVSVGTIGVGSSEPVNIPDGRPYTTGSTTVTLRPVLKDGTPRLPEGSDGERGPYRATFVLAIPGTATARENFDFTKAMTEGDSLIRLASPSQVLDMRLLPGDYECVARANANSRLSHLVIEIPDANSLTHAQHQAYNAISPLLSILAFTLDAPLAVSATQVEDLTSGAKRGELSLIGQERTFSGDLDFPTTGELLMLTSTYRDGLSSTDPFHQALSFLKVLEGVFELRRRRREEMLAAGMPVTSEPERIPTEDELRNGIQPPGRLPHEFAHRFAGAKFTKVRDVIWSELRNSIAHFSIELEPLSSDDFEHVVLARQAVPVIRFMAKELLVAELALGRGGKQAG